MKEPTTQYSNDKILFCCLQKINNDHNLLITSSSELKCVVCSFVSYISMDMELDLLFKNCHPQYRYIIKINI